MSAPLIAVGVRRWFMSGDERIIPIDGVDLEVAAGEVVVLTGPSGSGKTTLLQMLAGFQRPDEGSVHWLEVAGQTTGWAMVAVVPQTLGLLAELTASENVAMPLLASGIAPVVVQPAVDAALAEVRVDHLAHRLVSEVSLGQQQRVAVARALVGRPATLIADELTSHQDGEHADLVLAAVVAAARNGTACLLAGHDPRLTSIAHRVIHLDDGRLVR